MLEFLNSLTFLPFTIWFLRQKCSTAHALIHLTENIRKYLGEGDIACDIFVDLQKAFDTIEHDILLTKVEHYGVIGLANN